MDEIQRLFEDGYYKDCPVDMYELTLNVSKFWSVLSEEDRDYIQGIQFACNQVVDESHEL